jgi:molecular chaperone DnaK (HSP70)
MEGLTEITEKMTRAEFEELYNRAVARLQERERRAAKQMKGRAMKIKCQRRAAARARGRPFFPFLK